jgi:hypothetical protein
MYSCSWLNDPDIPEWMKPDKVGAIISKKVVKGIEYLELVEAGNVMPSKVLSWFFMHTSSKDINAFWQVEGGNNWFGSQEFVDAMKPQENN